MTITKNEKGDIEEISIWHIIKGQWVHIVQTNINKDNDIKYYTNGIEEKSIKTDSQYS